MIFQILIIALLNLVTAVMYAGESTVISNCVDNHSQAGSRAARLGYQAPVAQHAQVHQMAMPQPVPAQQPAPQHVQALQPAQVQPIAVVLMLRRIRQVLAQLQPMPRARL